MDKIDEGMDQFLLDLHTMKDQLIWVKGATMSPAAFKATDMEDIDQKIDVLLNRLQSSSGAFIPIVYTV
ncbi:MAG TPA: hypothetical protein VFQ26_09700 [Nitrospiraceae bacterium]|nr:hypothetical protein [Nitrospiraceae bacterium]